MQNALTSRPFHLNLPSLWQDPSIRAPVLIFIAARFLTLVIGVAAVRFGGPVYNPYAAEPTWIASLHGRQLAGPLNFLIEPWHRWDTGWYLKVAVQGYNAADGSIIFAPLYPLLIALSGALVGDTLGGALLVSSVACLAFLLILYRLARRETGDDSIAQNTLLALIAFPTAFYMQAGYTESTFLAFTAGALLAARNRQWWITALLAVGATLTRLQGWVLFFPVGWLALTEFLDSWQSTDWPRQLREAIPRLAAVGAGPLAVLGFFIYLALSGLGSIDKAYGSPWGMLVRPPWSAVLDLLGRIGAGQVTFTEIMNLMALALIVVLLLLSLRTLPLFLHLYLWPTLILILLRYYPLYLLNGTLRYVLDFFPVFIALGVWFSNHTVWRFAWLVVGVILQVFMLYLFARWVWIA